MEKLSQLEVWLDPVARSGAENMAVDELLLGRGLASPLLRVYAWSEPSVSFGYFDAYETAQAQFPEINLSFVRRWTGGGIVDHREDLTYTLVFPSHHPWSELRGAESYQRIHQCVAFALQKIGVIATLTDSNSGSDSQACFENSVQWDVVNSQGVKLAGAGQKRSKNGLLHQGSVQGVSVNKKWVDFFINELAIEIIEVDAQPLEGKIKKLAEQKYATASWLKKR